MSLLLVFSDREGDEAEIGPFFSSNECDVVERVSMNGLVDVRFHGVEVRGRVCGYVLADFKDNRGRRSSE